MEIGMKYTEGTSFTLALLTRICAEQLSFDEHIADDLYDIVEDLKQLGHVTAL